MNKQSIQLIQTLITKTKDDALHWTKYDDSNVILKPLPGSPLNDSLKYTGKVSLSLLESKKLDRSNSYLCEYESGVIFLLLYSGFASSDIELRVQTKKSEYSKVYASFDIDVKDLSLIAQLKRLYNLVSSRKSIADIDEFVSNFIESE